MKPLSTKKIPFPFVAILRVLIFLVVLGFAQIINAATLNLTPTTGVYTVGSTFTMQVGVNTQGKSINAADGTITYNPSQLQVVSVNRSSSIFSLWTAEPSFTNATGRITFSGGLPSGFSGGAGNVLSVTFRVVSAGTARVAVSNGSVLAADGMGTNVLTTMGNGTYTLSAAANQPPAEVIVEFVPTANTPSAPNVESSSHPDPAGWYQGKVAELRWTVPVGVTGVRTLLNDRPSSVPTRVYETPISSITLDDLPEGESYFHIQFRNSDGWGRITSYRLRIDATAPQDFALLLPDDFDSANPKQSLLSTTSDTTGAAPLTRYLIQINGQEPIEFRDDQATGILPLPNLDPGYYTIIVEAFDAAGNSAIASRSLTITAFDKPTFTSVPDRLLTETIPVFQGTSRPGATVVVTLVALGGGEQSYTVVANEEGVFRVIPDQAFVPGVYQISAVATDPTGAKSEASETFRFVVEEPGYLAIGSLLINILSTIVVLVALLTLMALLGSYLLLYVRRLRQAVSTEATEVLQVLNVQFDALSDDLQKQADELGQTRKGGKLSKGETELIEHVHEHLANSRAKIAKEVADVIGLVNKK